MYLPDLTVPVHPGSLATRRVVPCLRVDREQSIKHAHHLVPAADGADLSYLDRLISKPWGCEFRVYEDDGTDVWCLLLDPGRRTSLHCHPKKLTTLLCLHGSGELTTCEGARYALEPGVVLNIEPGAYHRSRADAHSGLELIEIEMPKDKFDLLRIEDDHRSVTEPYEGEQHAAWDLADRHRARVTPLVAQPLVGLGPARLREQCARGRYRFAIETGEQARAKGALLFAIELQRRGATPREATVLSPESIAAASSNEPYLTIRTQ